MNTMRSCSSVCIVTGSSRSTPSRPQLHWLVVSDFVTIIQEHDAQPDTTHTTSETSIKAHDTTIAEPVCILCRIDFGRNALNVIAVTPVKQSSS